MVYVSWILLEVDDNCYPMFVVLPNFNGGDVWRCHVERCIFEMCGNVVPCCARMVEGPVRISTRADLERLNGRRGSL